MYKFIHRPLLWGLLTVTGTLAGAHAAPQAKPAAKSQPRPAGVLGMVPMAGVEGKIG
jgi:hypothetical protein